MKAQNISTSSFNFLPLLDNLVSTHRPFSLPKAVMRASAIFLSGSLFGLDVQLLLLFRAFQGDW